MSRPQAIAVRGIRGRGPQGQGEHVVTTDRNGQFNYKPLKDLATKTDVQTSGGSGNVGTVTSVALTVPAQFSVAGSPVTTSGTLAVTWATEAANLVFAGPASGAAAAPTFRSLVAADLPLFSSTLNGAVPGSGGGTANFLRADGTWALPPATGTVTSVAMTGDGTIFNSSVPGSPITTSGTLAPALLTQAKNTVLAGPATGANAAPTFRALSGADLPNPSATTLGGIESVAAVSHQWINAISTSGVPSLTQPAFSDISGTATAAQVPVGATYQSTARTSTAPNSTSVFTMGGLAGTFTPTKSGNIMLLLNGSVIATSGTINVGAIWQLSYGTGTAPTANAALTGTQAGAQIEYTNPVAVTAADVNIPITLVAVITGLTVNTAYWLDVAQKAVTGTGINLLGAEFSAIEI